MVAALVTSLIFIRHIVLPVDFPDDPVAKVIEEICGSHNHGVIELTAAGVAMAVPLILCVVVVEQRSGCAVFLSLIVRTDGRCDAGVAAIGEEPNAVVAQDCNGLACFLRAGEVEHCIALQGSVGFPLSPVAKAYR